MHRLTTAPRAARRCQIVQMACVAALWVAAAVTLPSTALAMTLTQALEAARSHDPQYRAALHELEAARQGIPIARAALLPQIGFTHVESRVEGSRRFPNSVSQEVTLRVDYASPQSTLQLRMPLFNYEAWLRLDQASAQTVGAESAYRARGLELADRVTIAYLQVLEAFSQQTLAEGELPALAAQVERATQRLRQGEGTRTEIAQAESALELAKVKQIDAAEKLMVARAALQRLTGQPPQWVHDIAADWLPRAFEPDALREWSERALAQNPTIEVRRSAVETARLGVGRAKAGHLPRLDLVGSLSRSRNESLANLDQTSQLRSLGVQLTVPLYSGGGVQASIQQADAERYRADEELRSEREAVTLNVHRLLQAADNAALRAVALDKSVVAAQTLLTAATRAQDLGMGTQTDVLDARSRLFAARREWTQARYDHLLARARMMVVCGETMQRVVEQVDVRLGVRVELAGSGPSASRQP